MELGNRLNDSLVATQKGEEALLLFALKTHITHMCSS